MNWNWKKLSFNLWRKPKSKKAKFCLFSINWVSKKSMIQWNIRKIISKLTQNNFLKTIQMLSKNLLTSNSLFYNLLILTRSFQPLTNLNLMSSSNFHALQLLINSNPNTFLMLNLVVCKNKTNISKKNMRKSWKKTKYWNKN